MYAISFDGETKLLQLRFVIYNPSLELTKLKLISPVRPPVFLEHRSTVLHDWINSQASSTAIFFFFGAATQRGSWPPHFWGFLDHTQRRTTVGRTPLHKWSAHRRDLYLTAHNTHNRQTSMPPVGFEPTISGGERPQTYALNRAATGTGIINSYKNVKLKLKKLVTLTYGVIHKSLRDFRLLRYSKRDGQAEGKHVNRGTDTPSSCLTGALYFHPWWRGLRQIWQFWQIPRHRTLSYSLSTSFFVTIAP